MYIFDTFFVFRFFKDFFYFDKSFSDSLQLEEMIDIYLALLSLEHVVEGIGKRKIIATFLDMKWKDYTETTAKSAPKRK